MDRVIALPSHRLDWRHWAFTLGVLAIVAIDVALPENVVILSFIVVPVIASIILADRAFTAFLSAGALVCGIMSSAINDYPTTDDARRLLYFLASAGLAVWLAGILANERELLRITLDSALEPVALFQAVRDVQGRVMDFRYVAVNPAAAASVARATEQLVGRTLLEVRGEAIRDSGLFAAYVEAMERRTPIILDDVEYPDLRGDGTHYLDIRGQVAPGDRLTITWRDVTETTLQRQQLAESERRFRLLAENSSDVVLYFQGGIARWASPSLEAVLGWSAEEIIGASLADLIAEEDLELAAERYVRSTEGEVLVTRLRMRARSGDVHWTEVHSGPFLDEQGKVQGAVGSFRLIDREMAAEEELRRRIAFDDLTGALNRNAVLERLEALGGDFQRAGDALAVLFIDVDDFKRVNDSLGHAMGDAVLVSLVHRIQELIRADDVVARLGGDEFLVILNGVQSLDVAAKIAETIRDAAHHPIAGQDVVVSVSIGVTLAHRGDGIDVLIARADHAMLAAKQSGRDQVVVVD